MLNAWLVRMFHATFDDELALIGAPIPHDDRRLLLNLMLAENPKTLATYDETLGDSILFDDLGTPSVIETRDDRILTSLLDALDFLGSRLGADRSAWQWGRLHTIRFEALIPLWKTLSIPREPDDVFPNGFPRPGDGYNVDVAGYGMPAALDASTSFAYTHGPTQRFVIDMDPAGPIARNALPGGNVWDSRDPHFRDDADRWRKNENRPVPFSAKDVIADAKSRLVYFSPDLAKLHAARCPSCGANIQVPPHAHSITCRYCSNVITVAHQKPPPTVTQGVPSTTLYIDPEEIARAGRRFGCIIAGAVGVMVLLPAILGIVAWSGGWLKSKVKPFPAECDHNETIELSGDWTGTGPVVARVEPGCKIHITNAKLKAPALMRTSATNVELTLEDVTLETTGPAIEGGSNLAVRLANTTITSSADAAIKAGHNLALEASASKITGRTTALDVEANPKLTFENATELTSSDGVAIKTKSGMSIDMDGGKIQGARGAILATSGTKITAKSVIFDSKAETLRFTSGTRLDLTDGAITSSGESAITCDGGHFTFAGTKIHGVSNAIQAKNGLELKATKKAALVSTISDAVELTSNATITLVDASIDGARNAIKSTVNTKVKLSQGARVIGRKGGIVADSNLEVDATGATIDGGSGPGLDFDSGAKIQMQGGALAGSPAIKASYKPSSLTLDGTNIEGEQQIPKR